MSSVPPSSASVSPSASSPSSASAPSSPSASSSAVARLLVPPTDVAARAREVTAAHASPALLGHSVRSWALAAELGRRESVAFDAELLWVASLLHDLGLVPSFDAHAVDFEHAGGAVARVFAAGAGWPEPRQRRLAEVVERHMWTSVDVALDPEAHLLERATSLDVSGTGGADWDVAFVASLVAAVPRLGFAAEFAAAIGDQAERKPGSQAGRTVRGGMPGRIAANPLDRPLSA
ncbi:HD domain-containing protein [Frigoribacterium sp. CFBP 13729]|uniref:HD domain-containing protein n=1 Tax=Frigoribacterium sp. CFBP 13729 TaxID=2775293 RepID=UPI00177D9AC5|nr:HD domain-containing protein [Frigoribacterium sp. CFBP 13729]MBD8611392.1 HD domain-containing protein [Frigoribacterium sp. CFBP 13729]